MTASASIRPAVIVSARYGGGVLEGYATARSASTLTLMVQGKDVVSVDDLTVGRGRATPAASVDRARGARSYISVALRKDGCCLGTMPPTGRRCGRSRQTDCASPEFRGAAVIAIDQCAFVERDPPAPGELRVTFDNMVMAS